MDERNLEQILTNIGKEVQEKQYDWNIKSHEFSDKYKNRKEEIINSLETKKKGKLRWPFSAAASVAIIACISLTAYAAVKLITFTISDEAKDIVTIDINKNTEDYIPPIEIIPNYLPDGYFERGGKYSSDDAPGGITIIDAGYSRSYKVPDVSDYEEQQIGGAKAVIIHKKGYEFCWDIYLFYEDTGHVIEVFGYETLSKDEMIKVCENLTYVEVPEKDPNRTYQAFEYEEKIDDLQGIDISQDPGVFDENSLRSSLMNIGDKIDYPSFGEKLPDGVQYSVRSINITDTVNKDLLNKDTAWDFDHVMDYIQGDGTLKPYNRTISEWKDGSLQERELGTVHMKNVEVTIEVQNPSNIDIQDLNMQPVWGIFKQRSDGKINIMQMDVDLDAITGYVQDENFRGSSIYKISYDGMPYYFDASAFPQDNHFYNMKLGAYETKEVHMWFAIPEDQIDGAYVVFNLLSYDANESIIRLIKVLQP